MITTPSRRALAVLGAGGLMVWSCASTPGPVMDEASAGASASHGGAADDLGGSFGVDAGSANVGGVASGLGSGGLSESGGAAEAGASGMSERAGAPAGEAEGNAEAGAGGAGAGGTLAGGAGEGGAGGSTDLVADFDGHCGHAWAAPGAAAPSLQGSVTPQLDIAGNWSFRFGRYRFVVAGARGARIIEFSIDGNNLIDSTQGSTFWPSPQQAYDWPPPAEIDSEPYLAESDATSLSFTSDSAKALELSVRKRFWVNAASGIVSIEYQLINQSEQSASWAPWEVTRVRAGGYTFAPRGPGSRTIREDSGQHPLALSLLPPAPAANGIEWLNYPSLAPTLTLDNYLVEFDGAEGWLAHANKFGKSKLPVLFVKSFVDAPDASLPANQAEIQLWTSGTASPKLIEVEEQGAEQWLLPGETLSWTVHWSACELPSSLVLSAGNAELAAFARAHATPP